MKFTYGCWITRPEYIINYAQEAYCAERRGDALHVVATAAKINRSRGGLINAAALTINLSSPMEDVLRIEVVHHAGAVDRAPHFEIKGEAVSPEFSEDEHGWGIRSGALRAWVSKDDWRISFYGDDRLLTASGERGMAHIWRPSDGMSYMSDSLELGVGEWVYGLGERFTPYLRNGQSVDMWNADGGTASELAYKNVPFYMTNRGYGVLVDDSGDVSYEIASEKVERVQFSTQGERLVYYILYGPHPKRVLENYCRLTGMPALPPAWSFGLWLTTSFTTNYDEATTSSFIDGMAQRDIPLSVFHFDCYWMRGLRWCDFEWDPDTFPDPEGMLKRYHEKGLRICVWINSFVAQESALFEEGVRGGYFLKKTNGDVWQTDMWQAGMAILDVTNPEAVQWYTGKLERLLDMGVDCFKTDFGERIPVRDIVYHDGSDPLRMHNYYTFLYNKMVYDLLKRKRGEGEAVLFARSGTVGSQQFPVHWGGDNTANYLSMAETLRAGLSMSHSGFGFWSHDISGFEQTAPAHVYKRWVAFGLLSSHSRLHGSTSYRVPWLFDEEACDVARKFSKLKCSLMPYLYGAAVEAHEHGTPMMRPMMLEFPDDLTAQMCDRQYMLGENLLVAPVFTESGDVDYYLPEGIWINLLDDRAVQGGRWKHEVHDFMSLPLMARPGSVIPVGSVDGRPDYDYADGVTLHVYALEDGQSATVRIPDLQGVTQAAFRVTRSGDRITVETDSAKPWKLVLHGMDGVCMD